jgi:hypothetical protein
MRLASGFVEVQVSKAKVARAYRSKKPAPLHALVGLLLLNKAVHVNLRTIDRFGHQRLYHAGTHSQPEGLLLEDCCSKCSEISVMNDRCKSCKEADLQNRTLCSDCGGHGIKLHVTKLIFDDMASHGVCFG